MNKIAFVLLFITSATSKAEVLEGIARNLKGEIVYLEKHTIEIDEAGLNKLIQVEYTKPDGAKFAAMVSDFSKSKTLPETTFEDFRFKSKNTVRILSGVVEFTEIKNNKVVAKKEVPIADSMVVSQGFDNFIKLNLSELKKAPVSFKFGVLENKDFFSLTGYKRERLSNGDIEFGIKASNWLIRFFASELKVIYEASTNRLKSFVGRSNILDDSGQPQDVQITYEWKSAL